VATCKTGDEVGRSEKKPDDLDKTRVEHDCEGERVAAYQPYWLGELLKKDVLGVD
jgi:hypothetical protein